MVESCSHPPIESSVMALAVSIVICTDGRASSLKETLDGIGRQNYSNFEVCIVLGPTEDGSRQMLEAWPTPIKIAYVGERNLSVSRNIGIELAAGDIVAFLDDDAIPEPEWLQEIVAAYSSESIGGAGGFVHDHTGVTFQYRFGTTDRLGRANLSWERATPELNFPFSTNFPHLLGANSSFRRSALLSVNGFDEEYDYFLDETDLAARMIDRGWQIAQISGAYVHHKFMPSAIRNETRVLKSWYSIIKNKIYYGLLHQDIHHSVDDVLSEATNFADGLRGQLEWAIENGRLGPEYRRQFTDEVNSAWADGLQRGNSGVRRLMTRERCLKEPPPFLCYRKSEVSAGGRAICFLTREYPPTRVGGVGRYIHQLATGFANLDYQVHVLTGSAGHATTDLEEGVWVHRVNWDRDAGVAVVDGHLIPDRIWRYSSAMLAELRSIAERRDILCVYAPIWDCEGIAVLRDKRFPLIVGLQTTLHFWLDSHPELKGDKQFMAHFGAPMLALEAEILNGADALHSISAAIESEIGKSYGLDIADRTTVVPLGLDDFSKQPSADPKALTRGIDIRILFVGRLEIRKGIDVLLDATPAILERFPNCQFDIVGNDSIPHEDGMTFRQEFAARQIPADVRKRVLFHGEVSEAELRGFYKACDIFVAPSRFESFGLTFVEAMMFGKPTIGCDVGGIPEVVAHESTGLLASPGSVASLVACLEILISRPELRRAYGAAGRQRYLSMFKSRAVVSKVEAMMQKLIKACDLTAGTAGKSEAAE